jgi:hypothetical protein
MCAGRLDRYSEDVRLKVLGDLGVVLEMGVVKVARLAAGHEPILNSTIL